MLLIISPAKKLDFSPIEIKNKLSNPIFQKDASTLASVLYSHGERLLSIEKWKIFHHHSHENAEM